jgi:hypothetical protein
MERATAKLQLAYTSIQQLKAAKDDERPKLVQQISKLLDEFDEKAISTLKQQRKKQSIYNVSK